MNRTQQADLLDRAAARAEPRLRAAFAASLDRLAAAVPRRRLRDALARRDDREALSILILAIEAEPFRPLEAAMRGALADSGRLVATEITPTILRKRAPFAFDPFAAADTARAWINPVVRRLLDTVPAVARYVLDAGRRAGMSAARLAEALLGSLGLTMRQAEGAQRLRANLESTAVEVAQAVARGDADAARAALTRRPDPVVVERSLSRFRRRATQTRALLLGTDQARRAASLAAELVWRQAVDEGLIAGAVKVWHHRGDARVRDAHVTIPGLNQGGVPLDQSFYSNLGFIRFPLDPEAPLANVAGCRCYLTYEARR